MLNILLGYITAKYNRQLPLLDGAHAAAELGKPWSKVVFMLDSPSTDDLASHRPKRRKYKHDALLLVEGDDNGTDYHNLRQTWTDVVAKGVEFTDNEFPPVQSSISGKEKKKATDSAAKNKKAAVRCSCGVSAMKSTVKKPTPNQGREYFHCPARQCPFFVWADGGGSLAKNLAWQRFPGLLVVNDFGFHAEDLRQGGVGDCWFLSALAVVAQRHDLIAKLFVDTTPARTTGCYALKLFLDGYWRTILIDDKLPVTAAPRRADLAFTSNLAYSRTGSVATGQQQLWVSLLEKAYAKAHGSYQSISGGHIAEALLDLTGAPTVSVDFSSASFSSELLWARLLCCKRLGLPAGCATAGGDPSLMEMGLCGSHAYSILDVREVSSTSPSGSSSGGGPFSSSGYGAESTAAESTAAESMVRLLRIRNPHGVGEWAGDWSDRSSKWSEIANGSSAGLERTGVDDGTFWMDFTSFQQGFSVLDVSLAYRGWHARSLPTAFPTRTCKWRLCTTAYTIRVQHGPSDHDEAATVHIMALQPSGRGSWCREDRKKSYKPGDVALIIARLDKAPSACSSSGRDVDTIANIVQVQLGSAGEGAERGKRSCSCACTVRLPARSMGYGMHSGNPSSTPSTADSSGCSSSSRAESSGSGHEHHEYLVLPICLGSSPSACDARQGDQPFYPLPPHLFSLSLSLSLSLIPLFVKMTSPSTPSPLTSSLSFSLIKVTSPFF
jgi:hypothetical protein